MTFWYRYDVNLYCAETPEIVLSRIEVIRTTPKGVWLASHDKLEERFVRNNARKRYAYPTVEEAKQSFIMRKRRQVVILAFQLKAIENALRTVETACTIEDTIRFIDTV